MGWDTTPRCRLCNGTENLEYCNTCKYYFCTECREKYPERVIEMMKEKTQDFGSWLAKRLFKD